jgi:nitrile hydratase
VGGRWFQKDVPALNLLAVENTAEVHNAIVCTLCSCYPRMLLGIPPEWYKSRNYRSRMVREPRAVLAEFGLRIPEQMQIRVHDSTADMRYIVLPRRPAGTDGWSEERLAALVNRDCMIGVAVPKGPSD